MNRIDINIPTGIYADQSGFLYSSDNACELSEDMLQLCLDNGIIIDAGWSQDGDPNGEYVIYVVRGTEVIRKRQCRDAFAAGRIVEELLEAYGRPFASFSGAENLPYIATV